MPEDWLPIEQAHIHLRADPGAGDDADIQVMVIAAKAIVSDYLRRPVPWMDTEGKLVPVPESVVAAAKLILGELYESREASANPLSPGVRLLLWPHRNVRVM